MSYLDAESIEHKGITELRNTFDTLLPDIKTNFAENDKIPFTDGDISFYSGGTSNENFQGKISVQIKSTTNKNVKKYKKFYNLKLSTLLGFKKLQGVLLLVVFVDKTDNDKNLVFYQVLSVPYLSKLIDENTPDIDAGKKVSIKLSSFPSSKEDKIAILKDAWHDLKNAKYDIFTPNSPLKEFYTSPYLLRGSSDFYHIMELTENKPIILYSVVNNHLEPIDIISNENLEKVNLSKDCITASFGEFGDFKGSIITLQKKNSPTKVTIKTGKEECLEIILNVEKKEEDLIIKNSSATIHKDKDIDNQILNLQLLQYISKGNQILFDGNPIIHTVNPSKSQVKRIQDDLASLQIIREANNILGIDLYNTDGLSENDLKGMNELINAYKAYKKFKDNEMLIVCPKIKDKYYGYIFIADRALSFFDPKLDKRIVLYNANQKHPLNPYLIAINKDKPIACFDGYNPYMIQNWYSNNQDRSFYVCFQFLLYWLNIAKLYKNNPNSKYLNDFSTVCNAFISSDFNGDKQSKDLCSLIKYHFFKTKEGSLDQEKFDNTQSILSKEYQDDDVSDFLKTYARLLLGIATSFDNLHLDNYSISVLKKIRYTMP